MSRWSLEHAMIREVSTDRGVDLKEVLIWSERYSSRECVRTRLIGVEKSHRSMSVSHLRVVEKHQVKAEKNCYSTTEHYLTRSAQIRGHDLLLFE